MLFNAVLSAFNQVRDGRVYWLTLLYQGFSASELRFARFLKLNIPFVLTQSVILDLLGDVKICISGYFNTCVSESLGHVFYICARFQKMNSMGVT
ncbi:hypothetical protein BRLA_c041380 [Brevibacillus laterosporus LMG 15441]|uniref:Uncharacterized protein n=1 Tax=Brevibacillus laterosporus LMG 15441 TaxID=1042163 RepID=A0A075RB08_BRELA|nr:hypothetical protein BRLA_c041380 [Brevibacillus laterosporus LMG 15441]